MIQKLACTTSERYVVRLNFRLGRSMIRNVRSLFASELDEQAISG